MKHYHTYERMKDRREYYRCIHPDCSHYIKKTLLHGKRAACLCGDTFILTHAQLRLRKPHCPNCPTRKDLKTRHVRKAKDKVTLQVIEEILGV